MQCCKARARIATPGDAVKDRMKPNLKAAEVRHSKKETAILGPDHHSGVHLSVVCRKPSASTKTPLLLFLPFLLLGLNQLSRCLGNQEILTKISPLFPELKGELRSCPRMGGQGGASQGPEGIDYFLLRRRWCWSGCDFSVNQSSQS